MDWINKLKPGDDVIVSGNSSTDHQDAVIKVERLTQTQIIIAWGTRYHKKNGKEVGGSVWHGTYIRKATKKRIKRIEQWNHRCKLVEQFRKIDTNLLTTDKLQLIINIANVNEKPHKNLSCFGKKLNVEACNHGCPVSDECYNA